MPDHPTFPSRDEEDAPNPQRIIDRIINGRFAVRTTN